MGFLKVIYDNSPIIIQNLFTTIKGYQLKKTRYNKIYSFYFNYYKNIRDVYKEQNNQIEKLLIHLKYNIPYYSKELESIPDEKLNMDVLLGLPIITKENLRSDISSFINLREKRKYTYKTGGTTGKSLTVFFSKEDIAKRMAFLDVFKARHEVNPFSKRASFTGKEIIPYKQKRNVYWRYNKAINQMLYSGFHVNERNIPYYIKSLNSFKPETLDGFPSSIYRIAKYINNNDINLSFQPICIFPTAETLLEHYKEEIEKAFKCPVKNQYASSEGAPFITECTYGKLHMNIETGFFNLKPSYDEHLYELIVTSFLNYTTPIVQYKIGDVVEYYEDQPICKCGNISPYVTKILGRQSDYLVSKKNGKITSANMSNVYKDAPNSIIAIQFVQKNLDKIQVNLVVDKLLFHKSQEEEIVKSLKYRFGNEINVEFNYLNELPKEKSGKTLFLKNKLKDSSE